MDESRTPIKSQQAPVPERLWWALFILVPLATNPISRWQYEPDKTALTLALVGALLGVSLRRGYLPKGHRSRVELWLVATLWLRWLATSCSILPTWSLWGDPAWRNGLWSTLAMITLFVLARRQLVTPERRLSAIDAILIGSAVVTGYGILQYTGLDPLSVADWVRVPSTLAHPNLLAAYLAMSLPLTAARFVLTPSNIGHFPVRRVALGGLFVIQLLCLVFTYSRAGWLAAMSGVGVMLAVVWWSAGRRAATRFLVGVGVLGGTILFVLSQLPPLSGAAPHVLQTLTSLFRWQGATAQIRLLGWKASLVALHRHMWLGYGPATFGAVLPWHLPPALVPFGGAGALGGRPHNVYLEVALESGVPSLFCFVLALVVLLKPLFAKIAKGKPTQEMRFLLAAFVGSIAANLVTYCFSFESVTTGMLFWSLSGMAHAMVQPVGGRPQVRRPVLGTMIVCGGSVLALWMMIPDVLAFVGESLALGDHLQSSVTVLERAIALAPTPEIFMGIEANIYGQWALEKRDETLWLRGDATHAMRVRNQPNVVLYWQQWGDYLRRWYNAGAQPDIALRSVNAFSEALRLSPSDPDLWLDRGLAWLEVGQPDLALADFSQAQILLPGYTRYYGTMSVYTLSLGDVTGAVEWQIRALEAQRAWDAWAWRR